MDLVFDRADKVVTICEVKFEDVSIGIDVIQEVKRKIERLSQLSNRTVQKVLITKSLPSQDLVRSGYFSRIILAEHLVTSR